MVDVSRQPALLCRVTNVSRSRSDRAVSGAFSADTISSCLATNQPIFTTGNGTSPAHHELREDWQTRLYWRCWSRAGAFGRSYAPDQIALTYWFANAPESVTLLHHAGWHQRNLADLTALVERIDRHMVAPNAVLTLTDDLEHLYPMRLSRLPWPQSSLHNRHPSQFRKCNRNRSDETRAGTRFAFEVSQEPRDKPTKPATAPDFILLNMLIQ